MTKEEAIQKIQDDLRLHHDYLSGDYRKALRMAIEALQQPEIVRCKDCRYHIPQDGRCRVWCQFVDPSEWCSRAKRKDGEADG